MAKRYRVRYRPDRRGDWHGLLDDDGSRYTAAEIEFMTAMERYKRERGRPFPTWCEVLRVLHSLGYEQSKRA